MILQESEFSDVNDEATMRELASISYGLGHANPNGDFSFAWPGAYRPRSSFTGFIHHNGVTGQVFASAVAVHYAYQLTFVEDFMVPGASVIDIGCGCGQRTHMLARYASSVVGIDADKNAVAVAHRMHQAANMMIFAASLQNYSVPSEEFDYAFAVEVIEHIQEDDQSNFVELALLRLRRGGLLFITTPDEETRTPPHVGTMTDEAEARFGRRWKDRIVQWDSLEQREGDPFDRTWNPRRARGIGGSHRIVLRK